MTAILVAPSPLFVALLAPMLDPSERVGRMGAAGLVLGFAGVAILVGVDAISSTGEVLGALAILGAAASYAVGAINVRRRLGGVPPLALSLLATITATVMTLPPAAATIGGNSPDLGEMAALLCLAAVGTAAAFVIYFGLIHEVGAGRASLVGYLIPPVALAYGAALLDEQITVASISGLVMILAGVTLASRSGPPRDRGAGPPPEPA
jgi:drug/metabolite transporter (DMT)-like permease